MDRSSNLSGLHELYVAFHHAMAEERGWNYSVRNRAEFESWWHSLPSDLRSVYESDYRRGYDDVVSKSGR
jgi:hypothetical protein